jgi:hypothetical protein
LDKDTNLKLNEFQMLCSTVYSTLRQKTTKSIQVIFSKVLVPVVTSTDMKNWAISTVDRNKIKAGKMRFCRPIPGHRYLQQIRNNEL